MNQALDVASKQGYISGEERLEVKDAIIAAIEARDRVIRAPRFKPEERAALEKAISVFDAADAVHSMPIGGHAPTMLHQVEGTRFRIAAAIIRAMLDGEKEAT
jgi:hypothetical protein